MLSIQNQAIFKKAKFKLGENTDSNLFVEYCCDYNLSIEVIQELVNHYTQQNQDNPNFYLEVQTQLNEKGIII